VTVSEFRLICQPGKFTPGGRFVSSFRPIQKAIGGGGTRGGDLGRGQKTTWFDKNAMAAA